MYSSKLAASGILCFVLFHFEGGEGGEADRIQTSTSLQWVFFLFICAYNAWVISPPTPSIPGRNYFALISNFVEERV
jgi:hypothetical protein